MVIQDEFLHTRLSLQPNLSLVEQDLEFLSDVSTHPPISTHRLTFLPSSSISIHPVYSPSIQGLEGRSNNPVSLLLDALQKPEADLGTELPSLLEWRQVEEGKVDHVVLGRGKPGGIWQVGKWWHVWDWVYMCICAHCRRRCFKKGKFAKLVTS